MEDKLVQYSSKNDLKFYFDEKNIPNQSIVHETYSYFNVGQRKGFFEIIDFLNLLWEQYLKVLDTNVNSDIKLKELAQIPLTPLQRHILYGMLIKWVGGYPVKIRDKTLETIEKEFLSYEEETPEKEFCHRNSLEYKREKQIEGQLLKKINSHSKPSKLNSNNDFEFDFEGLPKEMCEKIQRMFGKKYLNNVGKDAEWIDWHTDWGTFLNSIDEKKWIKALRVAIKYGETSIKTYTEGQYDKNSTSLVPSLTLRIDDAKQTLHSLYKYNNIPLCFSDIFVPDDWEKNIVALQLCQPPLITSEREFIGNKRGGKGVICSWFKHLQTKGIIKQNFNRSQLAAVLNYEIDKLELGDDGKTIDNYSKLYEDIYEEQLIELAK